MRFLEAVFALLGILAEQRQVGRARRIEVGVVFAVRGIQLVELVHRFLAGIGLLREIRELLHVVDEFPGRLGSRHVGEVVEAELGLALGRGRHAGEQQHHSEHACTQRCP